MDFVLPCEFIANADFPQDFTQPLNALQWCDLSPCCSGANFKRPLVIGQNGVIWVDCSFLEFPLLNPA